MFSDRCRLQTLLRNIFIMMMLLLFIGCATQQEEAPPEAEATTPAAEVGTTEPPPPPQVILAEIPEVRETIYFDSGSFEITQSEQLKIDPIAVRLRRHPDSNVIIIGHSSESDNEEDNMALSYERAFSVAIYIASVFGIEEERIQVVAQGQGDPASSGSNSRVELISPETVVRTLDASTDSNPF
ncbi:OmpA family protein (plasmid) [Photobacterium sp. GJ3]|uniref:OmpA family protein n=1 Tax=Photobacterium sp. GJ3 TaxID=2829502 RepID=UPI001B8ACA79|nr:OmpA family protein [Photobacterium sp. GJ3]QUJ70398.1 OmpA family protein [Photobacterium sp. GJ3]